MGKRIRRPALGLAFAVASVFGAESGGAGTWALLLWDKPISPVVGAEDLYSLHRALYSVEEDVFAPAAGDSAESGAARDIPARILRFLLLDLPLDYMPMLIQHEAFGHGYRLYEASYRNVSYGLHLPPPYGDGHGFALGTDLRRSVSRDQAIAISAAGMEANDFFACTVRGKWMASGSMNNHEADLYLINAFNRSFYAARTRLSVLQDGYGNDIQEYLRLVNLRHGDGTLDGRPMDIEDVQLRMLVDVLDPFAFYALWTTLGEHLVHGRSRFVLPMPEISGIRFLPMAHAGLSPFGMEYYLETLAARESRTLSVTYRQGDPGSDPFYGLGLDFGGLIDLARLSADVRVEAWRQPRLRIGVYDAGELGETPEAMEPGFGLWTTLRTKTKIGLVLEAGYKTRGFVQGEPLEESLIIRSGISFFLPDHPIH
ncbi:MAG: hypothetical protein ABIW76_16405 [Fibrobacteria bacterium]